MHAIIMPIDFKDIHGCSRYIISNSAIVGIEVQFIFKVLI